jgi:hypothetical protein
MPTCFGIPRVNLGKLIDMQSTYPVRFRNKFGMTGCLMGLMKPQPHINTKANKAMLRDIATKF